MKFVTTSYKEVSYKTFEKFKNIKAIVFDFDNTLYKYLDWEGYNEFFVCSIRKLFPELTDNQFDYYIKKYKIRTSDRTTEITAELLLDLGKDTKGFVQVLKGIKYPCNWSKGQIFPQSLLRELSKNFKLYIVSNSAEDNIKFVSKNMGINLKYFSGILSNKFQKEDLSKLFRLKEIVKDNNLLPSEVLMVGDSVKYDLTPAKKLGLKTLFIKDW